MDTVVIDSERDAAPRLWFSGIVFFLLLVLGGVAAAWGAGLVLPPEVGEPMRDRVTAFYLGLAIAVAAFAALVLHARLARPLAGAMDGLAQQVDTMTGGRRGLDLVAVSLVGLFLEVLLIRWHATVVLAASYFKNVTLLASFLGLGLGFAAAHRRRLTLLIAPIALAAQVIVLTVMDVRGADEILKHPSGQEWVWGISQAKWDSAAQAHYWLQAGVFYGFFALLFVSTILIFIPIGQLSGRLMLGFGHIRAYTINIFGSLAGVALFGLVSYLWLPPIAWFGITGILFVFLLRHERAGAVACTTAMLISLCFLAGIPTGDSTNVYSPYQRLKVQRLFVTNPLNAAGAVLDAGIEIDANKAYHLRAVNLGNDFVEAHQVRYPRLGSMAKAYDKPYRHVKSPRRVLVVGSGGGNDVAAALRAGALQVDAVEIDPAILQLGQRFHPERPYSDPRVRVFVNDARAFMRRAESGQYDLIVFGLLDSHTLLSGMSAVRLDNFVYTRESLREAKRLLTADGVVALSFATGRGGFLGTRLFDMLTETFGHPPQTINLSYDDATMFLVGSGPAAATPDPDAAQFDRKSGVTPATDDWPFLYLQGREWTELPASYFIMVGILAVISVFWVLGGSGRRTGISPHFFFLGGAFLLIEVKGITELALIYGTTWIVSSVVIAAILGLILLANLFVTVFPRQNQTIHYVLLAASLLSGYFVRLDQLLTLGWWTAALLATGLLVLPLFFAGVIFASSLKQAASLPRAFSSNLLGAILGGLCEYSSMSLGFRNLYLVGLGLYALSYLTGPFYRMLRGAPAEPPRPPSVAPPPPSALPGKPAPGGPA